MTEKVITNIICQQYIKKLNKYIVEVDILSEDKIKIWLTEKQMINLEYCFKQTPRGYSNKNILVIGVFDEKGYYCYSKIERHKQERLFKIPNEYDLSDLREDD